MALETKIKQTFLQKLRRGLNSKLMMLATAGTFAFSACDGRGMGTNSCHDDYDCPGQELCIDGSCIGEDSSCHNDYDCPGDELCISGVCKDDSYNNNNINKTNIGGISVKTGKTSVNGQINFTDDQTGEDVDIYVKDNNGNSVSGAPVTFFDGSGFEAFIVNDDDFAPSLSVFAHNSSHDLSLTVAPWQVHNYNGSSNNDSVEAASKFNDYVRNNGQTSGCELADEISADNKSRAIALTEICDDYANTHGICDGVKKVVTWFYDALDIMSNYTQKLEDEGIIEPQCKAYKIWDNTDVSQWNIGPSLSLRTFGCMTEIPSENCSNGIDDDCDHKIDGADPDCQGPDCYSHDHQTCHNGDVYWVDSCGSFEEIADNCNSNETCQNGTCVPTSTGDGTYCDSCEDDIDCATGWGCVNWNDFPDVTFCVPNADCNNDADCNMGYKCQTQTNTCGPTMEYNCKNGDVWKQDTCGNWITIKENCTGNETCYNGECVDDGPDCTSHDHKTCSGGDVYWVDSCGGLEDMADNCNSDETCQNGACVDNGSTLHYEMLGDGTVLDTWTGKIWELNSPDLKKKWVDANNYCENLVLGGSSNWSLPSSNDLLEIKEGVHEEMGPPSGWGCYVPPFFPTCTVIFHTKSNCITDYSEEPGHYGIHMGAPDQDAEFLLECFEGSIVEGRTICKKN